MIRFIGFDADDTLWHNENIFALAQQRYRALLARYHDAAEVDRALFATEMRNLPHYGYYQTCWHPWPFPPDWSHCTVLPPGELVPHPPAGPRPKYPPRA